MSKITIMIVDDHEIMRRGLSLVLEPESEFSLVGEACDGEEAYEKAIELRPDVILMDVRMPKMNGIEAARQIKHSRPATKIIMLTALEEDEEIFDALNSGVDGYILKDMSSEGLKEAVWSVRNGVSYLQPQVARRVMERLSKKPALRTPSNYGLTERELIILKLMAAGLKNKEIAEELFISEETVKSHVSHVLQKLGQQDRMRAVLYAIRNKLVSIESTGTEDKSPKRGMPQK
jgi:DNA-binding NarL/FixJ family response regulator